MRGMRVGYPVPPTRSTLRAVDLFSGAGGVTTGYKAVGIKVIAAVDTDAASRQTYAANHPDVRLFDDDLSVLAPHTLLARLKLTRGELDILTACAPCQTFSTMGAKHRKPDDPRNRLVERVAEFVDAFLPRAVVMENVPQLRDDERLLRVIGHLHRLGYGMWRSVVNAADFGVPQRRRRLVLIALRGWADDQIPRLTTHHPLLAPYAVRRTVKHTFEQLKANGAAEDPLNIPRTKYSSLVAQRIAAIPHDGGSRGSLSEELKLSCHKRLKTMSHAAGNVYGRMKWGEPSPTLTTRCVTPSCGRFLHPEEDRAITLREAACLQTFPPNYVFKGGTMAVQAQIGNAVPPRLAEAIAVVVSDALAKQRSQSAEPATAALVG